MTYWMSQEIEYPSSRVNLRNTFKTKDFKTRFKHMFSQYKILLFSLNTFQIDPIIHISHIPS